MVTQADIRWLSRTVGVLHEARTPSTLLSSAMDLFAEKWVLQGQGSEQIAWDGAYYTAHCIRTEYLPADYLPCIHDHPAFALMCSRLAPPLTHIRALAPLDRWYQTDHYNGIARPCGFKDQLILTLAAGEDWTSFSLFRDRFFQDHDHRLLEVVQEHLSLAWRRLRLGESPVASGGRARLRLGSNLKPLELDDGQRATLQHYFPREIVGGALPPAVDEWLRSLQAPCLDPLAAGTTRTFIKRGANGILYLTYFGATPTEPAELLLFEHQSRDHLSAALTKRERAVLEWLLMGKKDAEIATLLEITRSTASKHVEHILRKVQVRSRTALIAKFGASRGTLGL